MTVAALEALVSIAQTSFPDADYIAPNGVLTIRGDYAAVTSLRVELPPGQFLHLQSLSVSQPVNGDPTSGAGVTASSWYRDFEERFDAARLFDFVSPTGTTVHTQADDPAWIQVRFAAPVDVSEVRLRNVAGGTASRSQGIRITVESGGGHQTVYDASVRESELVSVLNSALLHGRDRPDPAALSLVPVIAQALFGSYRAARTAFDALEGLTDDVRREFRALMSRTVLAGRSLEWTIHGPQRCFRFWSESEKARYLQDAVAICDALTELTPKVCFGFGSALAMVRDGDLIPHDDDLDIIVGFDEHEAANLPAANKLIEDLLRARGFKVAGNFTAHRHVSVGGRKHLDVFVGLFEGDAISWYPSARGILEREIMYPTSEGTLFGVSCPLPRNPLVYLERVYGPTWRNPDPGFKHRWNRAEYIDLVRKPVSGQS